MASDGEQRDQQLTLEQSLRRNRGPTGLAVHRLKRRRQFLQHLIGDRLDRAQGMGGGHSGFGREVAEHHLLAADIPRIVCRLRGEWTDAPL